MTLVALAFAWLGSVAVVATWAPPWWLPGAALASLAPAAARGWLPISWRMMLALGVAGAVGAWRFDGWETREAPALVAYAGQQVTLEGTVGSLPDPGRTVARYRVDIDRVEVAAGAYTVDGAVLITVSQHAEYDRGTRLRLTGSLDEAPMLGDFDYRAFLLRQGIAGTMFYPSVRVTGEASTSLQGSVDTARLRLERAIERALPEPEASLAAGIALGRDGGISPELYEAYRGAGLAHIIAVSGSNLTILTGIVFLLFVPVVGRNAAVVPAALAITAYLLLAGIDWPVTRAWIMAVIFLTGTWLGRQDASLAALGAAAMAMAAIAPGSVRDVGFQLSVAATAGLVVFGPWMRAAIARAARLCRLDGLVPPVAEQVMAMSLAASVATAPLVWINFGEVSIVGPIANVAVEPLFVLAFALSMLTAVVGAAWEPAGWLAGLAAYYPLAGCSWVATHAAAPEAASISLVRIRAAWAVGAYAGLAVAGWAAYRYPAPTTERVPPKGVRLFVRRGAVAAGCGGFAAIVVLTSLLPMRGPGDLELAVLDAGQGDAILVTTPNGGLVLIDGGPSGIETAAELSSQLPHWKRSIDAVVLTHPQQDHLGGLPDVLQRYDAGTVYESGATNSTDGFAAYREQAGDWRVLTAGDAFAVDGVRFEVLWPDEGYTSNKLNNLSLVVRIDYGSTRMLLTGDIEGPVQTILMARGGLEADVLKVPHHGSATNSRVFLAGVDATVAVISVGRDNPFGHPADEALQALEGAAVYRTDVNGRVVIRSNGERIEVRTERR